MRKKIILLQAAVLLSLGVIAQQLPQFSQYQFNTYAINPAVAGINEYVEINSVNRYQWQGIVDAPRTYTLSFQAPMKNMRSGVGAFLYTDIVGPTRRIGLQGSYSYHLQLKDALKLSIALSAGVLQYSIDGSRIGLTDVNDAALQNILGSETVVDAKFGLYLHSEKYYLGLSVPQIAHNKLKVFETNDESKSFLANHIYAQAGYKYELNDNFDIEPSVLVKYVDPAPLKIDANIKVEYQSKYWIGGGWRSNDSFNVMLGYNWNNNLLIGYAHDFTSSDLKQYSGATHEVMLGIRLHKK